MQQDFNRRFAGVKKLYGEKGLSKINQSHIVVIGVGGVGSWVAEALARNAIGKITMIDMDVVAESNINRQLPALSSTIGQNKIDVMAERISEINSECTVIKIDDFLTKENIADLIAPECSYVIDCMDDSRVKAALLYWCKRQKIKIITLGGAGGQIDPSLIKISDLSRTKHDPLLSKTRKILRQNYGYSHNIKRRFSIPCVYSTEHLTYPSDNGEVSSKKPDGEQQSDLTCSGGIGSSMMVTATFGFIATAYVLKKISSLQNE